MSDLSEEQRQVVNQLADEFEAALRLGKRPSVENALVADPALRVPLLMKLALIEIKLRRSAGERPTVEGVVGYEQQIPDALSLIDAAFYPTNDSTRSTDQPRDTDVEKDEPQPARLGRYIIQRQLGRGGFGVVYLAHDSQLDRPVALKVPQRNRFKTLQQVTSFIEEARTAARLKHANLVCVHDVQEEHGVPYIVQEYIEGSNLGEWAANHQPSVERIVKVLLSISEAIGYAHHQGLTHCDLKLANVLIDADGQPHVADFGLAVHENMRRLRKGEVFGTPAIMAPEQVRGEGHRLDGRTDIWAIGVMLYELLAGRRPFTGSTQQELFNEIITLDPRPLRQIDPNIPRELERICLKCLSKKRTERYNTTDDLREDLVAWLDQDTSTRVLKSSTIVNASNAIVPVPNSWSVSKPARIVPKGLRSFDSEDADFFLDLLPGPRDRDGLPESIRFWKKRIEETDPDKTFSVGLIYGPSGCGKSSLVEAGLLPRLSESVLPIFVEATAADTESRIIKQLCKHFPQLPLDVSLVDACAELRVSGAGRYRKLLLVIDQFEQWLHSHAELEQAQLVDALRQCEGGRLQTILLVRDDFFASVHRLFQELEQSLVDGNNYTLIDRFDKEHARKALVAFGRAYNKFGDTLQPSEQIFVTRAVNELAEDDKVISVRLALFADMMKSRPWVSSSLEEVGGISGVGVTFLDETFSSKSAPPAHRVHEQAIRGVLKSLLPEAGTDIKGGMRSESELQAAADYHGDPKRFRELTLILDTELRIVTPTEPEGRLAGTASGGNPRFYQLTHDYLVPSLREWLTRKQRETRKGRAELKLEERASLWSVKQENRFLPSFVEWVSIRCLTNPKRWTDLQSTVMGKTARLHLTRVGSFAMVLLLFGIAIQQKYATDNRKLLAEMTVDAVYNLQIDGGSAIPNLLDNLKSLPPNKVSDELRSRFAEAMGQEKLSLAYGLASIGQVEVDAIVEGIIDKNTPGTEVRNIIAALKLNDTQTHSHAQVLSKVQAAAQSATTKKEWRNKTRLAIVAMYAGEMSIAEEMLRVEPDESSLLEPQSPLDNLREELDAFEQLTLSQKSDPQVRLTHATACYYLDRHQETLKELNELEIGKTLPNDALLLQSLCLARAGSAEKAEEALSKLAATTTSPYDAVRGKILTLAWLGNLEQANRQFEELVVKETGKATGEFNAARIAAQLVRAYGETNPTESDRLTKSSVELLRQAYALGYRGQPAKPDLQWIPAVSAIPGIDDCPDLAPLYGDAEFKKLVLEVSPPTRPWDPVQRTEFIAEFPEWCGELTRLVESIQLSKNAALRSGISLAVGSVQRVDDAAEDGWKKVFENWYTNESDSGSHNAASWALRQWGSKLPTIEPTTKPSSEKAWWRTPMNLTMVKIPTGSVRGTSPMARRIEIKQAFWLGDREISIEQFKQFIEEAKVKPEDWQGAETFENRIDDTHPVQKVSWEEAVMYCNWLSVKHGLDMCYEIGPPLDPQDSRNAKSHEFNVRLLRNDGFRLPTADEWEYACRARTTTDFSTGNDNERLKKYAVLGASKTNTCGSKLCNPWGLHDMHGNVWEWCWDAENSSRVDRGGSWDSYPKYCQSAFRLTHNPQWHMYDCGFRVAQGP